MKTERFSFAVSDSIGSVTAEVIEPSSIKAMMTLAHGAGAGMDHRFMKALATALAEQGIGTLRFNFPYTEKGKSRPDVPAVAEKTIEAALNKLHTLYPQTVILAAGKSFGGRMSSNYVSKQSPVFLRGLVFYGFPLHPAGQPSTSRAVHLHQIKLPMLFLQGTRDALADPSLIRSETSKLSTATLTLYDGADHSFKSGKKEFISELASGTFVWLQSL
jgi:predicted alpha/beta-hydrolase family hydrolase